MAKICVLGAGMVGAVIAQDLAKEHEVTSADASEAALAGLAGKGVKTEVLDIADRDKLTQFVAPYDLVACAVPGFLGFETLRALIKAGKNVVDISFFPENALLLDNLAKEIGVTAIVDIGVAPGMDNVILGFHDKRMTVKKFECIVGGLPKNPKPPFFYKAPFSPIDVIEEYTRPARLKRDGKVITLPALSEVETVHFENVGNLEAFNTDGLRSLLITMPHIPDMAEKTLRYPGHVALIEGMKAAGFFAEDAIEIKGAAVRPLDLSAKLLIDQWKLEPGEPELTVMRVTVEGEEQGKPIKHVWELLDEYDPATGFSSMSRTTGFTCTAAANLLLQEKFTKPGVHPPENVGGTQDCFKFMRDYLAERNVLYCHSLG
ncbi:MAG: saccharopine dehydrogenase NADP-binding domain-containing protein [Gammaproteobacteria bacterium]|nr:saccharopine dehydrogenase NADP-binding domain-containing protein [Gammaproteobacteria bacterium]